MSNIQQGMSNVQVLKRFALLILKISKWQDTLLGHWTLEIGYWILDIDF
jgi:hypothetical protein